VVSKLNAADRLLPGQVLSEAKNLTKAFAATSRAQVAQKATGQLTIYNAYSSEKQQLVATTRFVTPDGKVFRLDEGVTVPGAQVKDGKIIPSSIEVSVTADKPGAEYNVGPIPKLTVPGFKGSPKYNGFYGEFKDKTSGGFVGERATPSEKDIADAKDNVVEFLKTSLQANVVNNRPVDLKIVNGASEVKVTRLTVNKNTNDKGEFHVFGEAQFRAMAFREEDVRQIALGEATKNHPGMDFKSVKFDYRDVKVNFDKGEISFTVEVQGALWPALEVDKLKTEILGIGIKEAQAIIRSLPQLEKGTKITLWPIWLGKVPRDPDRVRVVVE
jgi:hypothetical protein